MSLLPTLLALLIRARDYKQSEGNMTGEERRFDSLWDDDEEDAVEEDEGE